MRLWTLHPQYLDRQGLLAVWREGLLAQAVLLGQTKGYKNHPQLLRFKQHADPASAIACYLEGIYHEACRRSYNFNRAKYTLGDAPARIPAPSGQMEFEIRHLLAKLNKRSPDDYARLKTIQDFLPHPLFTIHPGPVADWEKGLKG